MKNELTLWGKTTLKPIVPMPRVEKERCEAVMVPVGWRRDPTDQCKNVAKVLIDGKLYCKTHAAQKMFDDVFILETHDYRKKP